MSRPRIQTKGSVRDTDKMIGSARTGHVGSEQTQDTDKGEWSGHGQNDRECQDRTCREVSRPRIRTKGSVRDTDKTIGSARTGYAMNEKTRHTNKRDWPGHGQNDQECQDRICRE